MKELSCDLVRENVTLHRHRTANIVISNYRLSVYLIEAGSVLVRSTVSVDFPPAFSGPKSPAYQIVAHCQLHRANPGYGVTVSKSANRSQRPHSLSGFHDYSTSTVV